MISFQDFERLSAYLDNQLSPKEKSALDARLAREPELKTALVELRQTVRAVRSLPVIKPPRNFTLSARQTSVAPQRRLFPTLRLATSMVALSLMLVFAGDFIANRTPALSPAAAPAQNTAAERSIAVSEAAPPAVGAASAPTPATAEIQDQVPAGASAKSAGTSAAGGASTAAGGASTSFPADTQLPEATPPMAEAAVLAASPANIDTPMPAPAAEQPTAVVSEPAASAKLAPTETPAPVAPTETLAPPTAEAYALPVPTHVAPLVELPGSAPGLPWRAVEIGLVGLTLCLATLTWLMRRR